MIEYFLKDDYNYEEFKIAVHNCNHDVYLKNEKIILNFKSKITQVFFKLLVNNKNFKVVIHEEDYENIRYFIKEK